ncbi:MAG: type II secretion system protein [Patescibacteria group bacterium]
MNKKTTKNQGFTLLELLIVIAIIAVLSVILILVLDPSETLKKSRDSQRMSDLATIKTALGLYSTSTTTPLMAGASNVACKGTASLATWQTGEDQIYYSYPSDAPGAAITDKVLDATTFTSTFGGKQATNANLALTNASGWLPVNLSGLPGGSPISNLPIDPVNTMTVGGVVNTDLVYRYACMESTGKYEIDARLESTAYTSDDNKMSKDGGNNANYYEVGTDLTILGTGTDF